MPIATRLIARLAVEASLVQFPALRYSDNPNYNKNKKNNKQRQQLPLEAWRQTPWCVALEAAILLSSVTNLGWMAGFAVTATVAYVGMTRKWPEPKEPWMVEKWILLVRPILVAGILGYWLRYRWSHTLSELLVMGIRTSTATTLEQPLHITNLAVMAGTWLRQHGGCIANLLWQTFALLGPLLHLRAFGRIVRIRYTHNQTLASGDTDTNREWRWYLDWRPPESMANVIRKGWRDLNNWLFWRGSVDEKLQRMLKERRVSASWQEGVHLLQQLEQAKRYGRLPFVNRQEWKDRAIQEQTSKHQNDYLQGIYSDPLGVAVQQTLGVGLGFEINHMRPLQEGEEPSLRRLQARAAKSAIFRAQELQNATRVTEILDSIEDVTARENKKLELRQAADQEINWMADQLSRLIPTEESPSEFEDDIRFEQYQPKFRKTGPNEYSVVDGTTSPAIAGLLEQDDFGMDPSGRLGDDEFLKALRDGNITDDDVDILLV